VVFQALQPLTSPSAHADRRCRGDSRRLNPWWGASGSPDDPRGNSSNPSLTVSTEATSYPHRAKVWAGKGTGQTCAICTQIVYSDEVASEAAIKAGRLIRTFLSDRQTVDTSP